VPEERKRQALVLAHGLGESISIGFSDLVSRRGWMPRREELDRLRSSVEAYSIRAKSLKQAVGTLSGGNQQKAVLARWLGREPEVIVLNEPTRGVDVAAKAEIHALLGAAAERGKAMLLISSDLPELVALSDRVLVFHRGRIAAELEGELMTQENVVLAASGLEPHVGGRAQGRGEGHSQGEVGEGGDGGEGGGEGGDGPSKHGGRDRP
jgi:ABC-type sugar transport system ATPase subunit